MVPSPHGEDDELAPPAGPARDDPEGVALGHGPTQPEEEEAIKGHGVGVDAVHVAHVAAYLAKGLEEVAVHGLVVVVHRLV